VPNEALPPPLDIEAAAFLVWSERCVQCAAPACYTSCDLYEPRSDGRCRRFAFGAYPNRAFRTSLGPGAEIVFRRWAKLEARGNLRMEPLPRLRRLEAAVDATTRVADVFGGIAARIAGDARLRHAGYSLTERFIARRRKAGGDDAVDGFLVELFNPSDETFGAQIVMAVDRTKAPEGLTPDRLPRPVVERLDVSPGFFRHLIPAERFRDLAGSGLAYNISFIPKSEEGGRIVVLMLDFVRLRSGAGVHTAAPAEEPPPTRPAVKCLVFDLDNTLWDGVLLERHDVALRRGARELIEVLDRRGILLSVVSKNAHDHAWARIEALGLGEYFLFPKINWAPKSVNVAQLARDLNRTRRQMYCEAMVRDQARAAFGEDYLAFLRECSIKLDVSPYAPSDFDRTAELVQRTNQLNFSGAKYGRDQLRAIIDDPALEKWVVRCSDKFGSYGTVGFCIVARGDTTVTVRDFMLSCRVQGKFIEQALFDFLVRRHPGSEPRIFEVLFRQTDRNDAAARVLDKLGFKAAGENRRVLDLTMSALGCDFITMTSAGG
jgi:HAD superfamily phosphatase (TIGR01681 family)